MSDRVVFQLGNAAQMPFPAESFDFAVSRGSLHHWKEPTRVFNEIYRVLKGGGGVLIGDLRRNSPKELRDEMAADTDSRLMRWGLKHSFSDAYTRDELLDFLTHTHISDYNVDEDGIGLTISLKKLH